MAELFFPHGDDGWRCRKHPAAQPSASGVCPLCLRDRLLRLCPECAGRRPGGCSCPSTSSTASSSSLSSVSSLDLHRCGTAGAQVGAVGPVSHLIECEPAFRRSRSAAFRLLGPRPGDAIGRGGGDRPRPEVAGGGWSRLWPFQRGKKADEEDANDAAAGPATVSRSRSVGAVPGLFPNPGVVCGGAGGGEVRSKVGWNRYLPNPMKAFRRRKASKDTMQARLPIAEEEDEANYAKTS